MRRKPHIGYRAEGTVNIDVLGYSWKDSVGGAKVVDAYENVGVEVTLKEAEPRLVLVAGAGNNQAELEELIGKLRAESDMVRAVIDGHDAGEIEKPEAGELAIRLFQALDGIRLKMVELAGARDDLATENQTLRNELTELKWPTITGGA
jgi:hypothetical protein